MKSPQLSRVAGEALVEIFPLLDGVLQPAARQQAHLSDTTFLLLWERAAGGLGMAPGI